MSLDKFKYTKTKFKDLLILERNSFIDTRGSFLRIFNKKKFKRLGFNYEIDSINYSVVKKKGTIKGLHFQTPPHAEAKIVTCLKGSIYDVCVDLRKDSKTFLKCHYEILTQKNKKSLMIPKGFAHGFQTLEHNCELLYLHSNSYRKTSESGINFKDKVLSINWPLKVSIISKRDMCHRKISKNFKGLKINEM